MINVFMINLPNALTLLRIASVPFIMLLWQYGYEKEAFFLFTFACLTDFADGYLAQKMKRISSLGAFLDPLADKILVLGLGVYFLWFLHLWPPLQWPFFLMGLREILVVCLRLFFPLPCFSSVLSAKGKTALSMLVLGGIMMPYNFISSMTHYLIVPLTYCALFLSFYSFSIYLYGFFSSCFLFAFGKKSKKN